MKCSTDRMIDSFFETHAELIHIRTQIEETIEILVSCFSKGGKLLLCGNGGSCADCDHISGELIKGFLKRRPADDKIKDMLTDMYGEQGLDIAEKIQTGLPALSLCSHNSAISAFANDVDPELVYAQQVYAFGKPDDVLIGISTSGNSRNVLNAVMMANAIGIKTVALSGKTGGNLSQLCEYSINTPYEETFMVQESHLAIYHLICMAVEEEMFRE